MAVEDVAQDAAEKGGHGRQIGLLIAFLALFLAIADMLGGDAQTNGLAYNIEASNTWNFFQAKTIRQSSLRGLMDNARMLGADKTPEGQKQMAAWQATIDRWESEPSTNEGRKELIIKAKDLEAKRDQSFAQDNAYDSTALILQLGIVLASVALISSMMIFAIAGGVLGVLGVLMLLATYMSWPIML